jgi:hypothetical protein
MMMADPSAPFRNFASCHPKLQEAVSEITADWDPDPVPLTVGFGNIGRILVQLAAEFDDATLDEVSRLVEHALSGGGVNADAIATGLLEAICSRTADAPAAVERIVSHLGTEACAYIRSWDAFTGTTTPGLTWQASTRRGA